MWVRLSRMVRTFGESSWCCSAYYMYVRATREPRPRRGGENEAGLAGMACEGGTRDRGSDEEKQSRQRDRRRRTTGRVANTERKRKRKRKRERERERTEGRE